MIVNFVSSGWWRRLLPVLLIIAFIAGCAGQNSQNKLASVPEARPGYLIGYLATKDLPNSLALIPPPPATGSTALALDLEISKKSAALLNTPRWTLAISDADLAFPHAAGTFSCTLNVPITEKDTPHLYMLLRRTLTDLGLATYSTKIYYNRTRPFVLNKEPMCSPEDKAFLEKDGSYPSGHTAIGWGWALILTEISPGQTDAILARGHAYGESRNVCNVHWHSDVAQGRLVAAGTVARLHADPGFLADLAAARAELDAIRNKGLKPTRDCNAEAAALAIQPSLAQ
jgi:acid phosphatase (class A)